MLVRWKTLTLFCGRYIHDTVYWLLLNVDFNKVDLVVFGGGKSRMWACIVL